MIVGSNPKFSLIMFPCAHGKFLRISYRRHLLFKILKILYLVDRRMHAGTVLNTKHMRVTLRF